MFNFDNITKEEIKEHNPKWGKIPDHSYQILAIGGCFEVRGNYPQSKIRYTHVVWHVNTHTYVVSKNIPFSTKHFL